MPWLQRQRDCERADSHAHDGSREGSPHQPSSCRSRVERMQRQSHCSRRLRRKMLGSQLVLRQFRFHTTLTAWRLRRRAIHITLDRDECLSVVLRRTGQLKVRENERNERTKREKHKPNRPDCTSSRRRSLHTPFSRSHNRPASEHHHARSDDACQRSRHVPAPDPGRTAGRRRAGARRRSFARGRLRRLRRRFGRAVRIGVGAD